jgi:hypothetical protein
MNAIIRARPFWWQWPTVLSLDAPIVALLWQLLLARVARIPLGWPHAFVLGASVWLAYVLDRWIEGWRLAPEQLRTQRHAFYQRWRWPVAIVWTALLVADLTVAWTRLTRREWTGGAMLLGPVVAYLLSHQWIHRAHRWRVPKEVCVAALFGGGVAVFLIAPEGAAVAPLVMPLALFTLLCFANCALISAWESEVDESHGQTSLALQYRGAPWIATVTPSLPLLVAAWMMAIDGSGGATRTVAACGLASGIALAALGFLQRRLGWQLARVLADIALMTPLVPLAARWLR